LLYIFFLDSSGKADGKDNMEEIRATLKAQQVIFKKKLSVPMQVVIF